MKCHSCNKELADNAMFCGFCGTRVELQKEKESSRSEDDNPSNNKNEADSKHVDPITKDIDDADEAVIFRDGKYYNIDKADDGGWKVKRGKEVPKAEEKESAPERPVTEEEKKAPEEPRTEKQEPAFTNKSSSEKMDKKEAGNKNTRLWTILIAIVIIIAAGVLFFVLSHSNGDSTLTEPEAWAKAESYNTITAYQTYLEMFPEGKNAFDAKQLIVLLNKKNDSIKASIEIQNPPLSAPNGSSTPVSAPKTTANQSQEKSVKVELPKTSKKPETDLADNNAKISDNQDSQTKGFSSEKVNEKAPVSITPAPQVEPPVKEDLTVYKIVDVYASYPGGTEAMYKFISDNSTYPIEATEKLVHGTVYVSAIVEKNGKLTDIKIVRGIGSGCDEEAIRVVKKMKNWIPGKLNNKVARTIISIPVKFKLL